MSTYRDNEYNDDGYVELVSNSQPLSYYIITSDLCSIILLKSEEYVQATKVMDRLELIMEDDEPYVYMYTWNTGVTKVGVMNFENFQIQVEEIVTALSNPDKIKAILSDEPLLHTCTITELDKQMVLYLAKLVNKAIKYEHFYSDKEVIDPENNTYLNHEHQLLYIDDKLFYDELGEIESNNELFNHKFDIFGAIVKINRDIAGEKLFNLYIDITNMIIESEEENIYLETILSNITYKYNQCKRIKSARM